MITGRRQTVGFVLNTHGDDALALKRVIALREHFPKAKVLIIADGLPLTDRFVVECLTHRAQVIANTERLKVPEKGGAWTERWIRLGMSLGTETIVKLDPDTGVFGTAEFPDAPVFGFLMYAPERPHGSLVGLSRPTAKAILRSGYLTDPVYVTEKEKYLYRRPGDTEWRSCQDLILGDVLRRLGIPTTPWNGIARLREERPPGMFDVPKDAVFAHPWRE